MWLIMGSRKEIQRIRQSMVKSIAKVRDRKYQIKYPRKKHGVRLGTEPSSETNSETYKTKQMDSKT